MQAQPVMVGVERLEERMRIHERARSTEPSASTEHADEPTRADAVSGVRRVLPLLVGGLFVVLSLQLPLGTATRPGPGLWPLLCGLLTLGAAVAALRTSPAEDEQRFTARSITVLVAAATLVGFTVAMPLIGFELSLGFLLLIWLRFFGKESWVMSVSVAVGGTAFFYLLFITGLGIEIPRLF